VWCVGFGLPIAAYCYHYIPYHVSVDMMHQASYVKKAAYFFAFLGCTIHQRWLAAILGLAMCGVLAVAVRSGFERTDPVPLYCSIWICLSPSLVVTPRHRLTIQHLLSLTVDFLFPLSCGILTDALATF
jgi:hypothetical protein